MKLTQEWFEQQGVCLNGFYWVRAQFSDEVKEIEATEIIDRLIAQKNEIAEHYKIGITHPENSLDWANWVICRVFSKEQRIKYAVFAAEQVIRIYEKQYPNDKRPREAIEATKKYLEDQSTGNANTARAANDAAYIAANAAYAAADAANDAAAYIASSAAAHAAYIAANAANDAAYIASSAADAAARATDAAARTTDIAAHAAHAADKMRERILGYGLELLQA